jgi:hypothetical protein
MSRPKGSPLRRYEYDAVHDEIELAVVDLLEKHEISWTEDLVEDLAEYVREREGAVRPEYD